MFRIISVPTVLDDVVGEGADGVEVSAGVGWVWEFGGGADGEVEIKQYGKYKRMYTLLCHIVTSYILSLSVCVMKIKRGPLTCIISWDTSFRKWSESAHRLHTTKNRLDTVVGVFFDLIDSQRNCNRSGYVVLSKS